MIPTGFYLYLRNLREKVVYQQIKRGYEDHREDVGYPEKPGCYNIFKG
jgi:hypothetical protein